MEAKPGPGAGNLFVEIVKGALALLFVYTALSKWLDFPKFRHEMLNQVFPVWAAQGIIYLLPAVELLTCFLLISKKTQRAGLWFSFGMMGAFTGYIGLVLLHFWKRVPCSCGGILSHLSWGVHLAFNFIFLLITVLGLYLSTKRKEQG